ncbi:hypothetical protein SAMN04488011_104399 [Palleronia pelagia]|uniref:Uncharacterized protein n=1 Tax=Palleronia pelagia TaxID=387096 RepID=A0A1H8HD63_9RHOB|nr:hypothetical protein SAMN04488011_104399 [Palleronia pelagia]
MAEQTKVRSEGHSGVSLGIAPITNDLPSRPKSRNEGGVTARYLGLAMAVAKT